MAEPGENLKNFNPVSLAEMDAVKLMNRMDTKFMFNAARLPAILENLQKDYRILEINGRRSARYETLYFDTPGHLFYMQHHNGKMNRVKVRFRRYVDSNLSFFEIKKKNNKGRTIKERIKSKEISLEITGKSKQLVETTTNISPGSLKPSIWVSFTRITLVDNLFTTRLTIDTGLHFKNADSEIPYGNLAIAELKQDRYGNSSFPSLMRKHNIPGFRISKYCLGIISMFPEIKQNNFKSKLTQIKKTDHEFN
jgi:hypothetical protein